MNAAGSEATNQPTKMKLALWKCGCGNVTVQRPRWSPGEPEHRDCPEQMVYIRDVPELTETEAETQPNQ
jgi:hypothetical protein